MDTLRLIGPPILALVTALVIDGWTQHRGLLPPWFRMDFQGDPQALIVAGGRRGLFLVILSLVLWIGVFFPLGSLGIEREIDFELLSGFDLFTLHLMLVFCLVVWYLMGYVPVRQDTDRESMSWRTQLGFRASSIPREIGIGLLAGVAGWLTVIGALLAVGVSIWYLGGEDLLPKQPPAMIPWIAGLPIVLRIGISVSAGVVEETFFRGFLQPRVGLGLSTVLFVLAHASYEQPMMLLGVFLLSVIYGLLVRWRQSIWAAIAAHALFDAVQLLLVIPAALRVLPEEGSAAFIAGVLGLF